MDCLKNITDEKLRISCLEEEASDLLKILLNSLSLRHSSTPISTDAKVVLSQIISLHPQQLLTVLNINPHLSHLKNKIFLTESPVAVRQSIDTCAWDIPSVCFILKNISVFPTSDEKYRRQAITCSGNTHRKCCDKCSHKKKSRTNCLNCNAAHNVCFKSSTPCCSQCNVCLYCSKTQCDSLALRESLDTIRRLRNLIHHSSQNTFHGLIAGTFHDANFPSVRNWTDLWQQCAREVHVLLDYLKTYNAINNSKYYRVSDDVINNIKNWSKERLYKQYQFAIDSMISRVKVVASPEKMHLPLKIDFSLKKLNELGLLSILWPFGRNEFSPDDRSLDSPLSRTIEKGVNDFFAHELGLLNGERCTIILRSPRIGNTSSGNDIVYTCFIKAKPGYDIPSCYENRNSTESRELWNGLREAVEAAVNQLHNVRVIGPVDWFIGSVNIDICISRHAGPTWSKEELITLDEAMNSIPGKVGVPSKLEFVHVLRKDSSIQYFFDFSTCEEKSFNSICEILTNIECRIINHMCENKTALISFAEGIIQRRATLKIQEEILKPPEEEELMGEKDVELSYRLNNLSLKGNILMETERGKVQSYSSKLAGEVLCSSFSELKGIVVYCLVLRYKGI